MVQFRRRNVPSSEISRTCPHESNDFDYDAGGPPATCRFHPPPTPWSPGAPCLDGSAAIGPLSCINHRAHPSRSKDRWCRRKPHWPYTSASISALVSGPIGSANSPRQKIGSSWILRDDLSSECQKSRSDPTICLSSVQRRSDTGDRRRRWNCFDSLLCARNSAPTTTEISAATIRRVRRSI
jgi:hypothetical protein